MERVPGFCEARIRVRGHGTLESQGGILESSTKYLASSTSRVNRSLDLTWV